jgi:hypothetical protein
VVATGLVLGCLAIMAGTGSAGDDKEKSAILKIADLIQKGDAAGATKQAKALAKNAEVEEVMHLLKPRKKMGLGVGPKSGPLTPDGIELMVLKLSGSKAPSQAKLSKEADALESMGYVLAAVGEFAIAKPPEKDEGKKKVSDWVVWAKEMREASAGFAEAAKSKSPKAVHEAAMKLNTVCTNCHSTFKE